MSLGLDTITIDCADAVRLATFWAEALGFEPSDLDPDGSWIDDPTGGVRGIFFQVVPEPKVAKDRIHLDLRPSVAMADEVERLVGLGATVVGRVEEGGSSWTVLHDPEGNEFCVLRGPADGWNPPGEGA
jgi:predicted enzyme related to lactoylglutathione lyase